MKRNKLITAIMLIFTSLLFSEGFSEYFKLRTAEIYTQNHSDSTIVLNDNAGWERITDIYNGLYRFRLNKDQDTDALSDRIETLIDDIDDEKIKNLTTYENDLITAFLYGSLAYIHSGEPSYSMFSSVKKARKLFIRLSKDFKKPDSEFGTALTDIALGMYFQDSFWIRSVLGYEGKIQKGLKKLDAIAFSECMTTAEANMFLTEYYAGVLQDHRRSIKYSQNLYSVYPGSKYFAYLYARDLYHTGKVKEAYLFFKKINDGIGDEYFGFEYESVIYEAKCLFLTGSDDRAKAVLEYAENIHKGYLTDKFRNEWLFSVRLRQEAVFRPANYSGDPYSVSDDELLRKAVIYFDHGFFREAARSVENIENKTPEAFLILLRTVVNMADFTKAARIIDLLEDNYPDFMDDDPDRLRVEMIKNIVLNYMETVK